MTDNVPLKLPQGTDPVENERFRKHSVVLGTLLARTVYEYLQQLPEAEQAPVASLGAAFFVGSHLVAVNSPDERYRQAIAEAMLETAVLNNPTFQLATIPPTELPN